MPSDQESITRTGKLFDYLEKLSRKEEKQFLEFFPRSKEKLYNFLVALMEHRKGAKALVPESKLWSKATGEPFDPERNLDPQKSKILSHLQEFYAWLGFKNDPLAEDRYFFREIIQRDLEKEIEAAYPRFQRKGSGKYPASSELYEYLFDLDARYNLYYTQHNRPGKMDPLGTLHGNLDAWFLTRKLLFASAAHTRNRLFNESHDLGMIQPLLDYIEADPDSHPPLVRIYYYAYLTNKDPDQDTYYDQLISLLETTHKSLGHLEKGDFYQHCTNYCIRKFNQGVEAYSKKLISLYEFQISEGILMDQKGQNMAPKTEKHGSADV